MHAGELPSATGYHGLITVYGFFLPVATGSYGLFTVNHVYEACWSDRVQTGGQVERGIPIGIPTKNQNSSLNYKSINYQIDSNYPGPPNPAVQKSTSRRRRCFFLCLQSMNPLERGLPAYQASRFISSTTSSIIAGKRAPTDPSADYLTPDKTRQPYKTLC